MILMYWSQSSQILTDLLQIQKIRTLRHLERTQQNPTGEVQTLPNALCERIETLTALLVRSLQFGEDAITIDVEQLQDCRAQFVQVSFEIQDFYVVFEEDVQVVD